MKIKKIVAKTEKEIIEKAKQLTEEGATVIKVEKIDKKSNNMFSVFKKPHFVATLAYDVDLTVKKSIDEQINQEKPKTEEIKAVEQEDIKIEKVTGKVDEVETIELENFTEQIKFQKERIEYLEKMLKLVEEENNKKSEEENIISKYESLKVFYDALINQGVLEEIAENIVKEAFESVEDKENITIPYVASFVYKKIVDTIKSPTPIKNKNENVFIFFMGPTGVGKTTTIAKLASKFVLDKNSKIGLITADTYRISAVEQLKTYADILNLDIDVIYEKQDFVNSFEKMSKQKDIVFVDTAGRSHKNKENILQLKDILNIPTSKEVYLVLSMTTKYEDLEKIIDTYKDVSNFKIIFTKFDETVRYGSMFNVCVKKEIEVVYITNGQDVPDDIELLQPEKIAKALLGLDSGI
ncbi:MAG: 50S ribosome-binding GTPase [Defluviitaleaceae bacterium]|nr:50S ribosome-binding GTPase [Defluviitaleaceae bacterium]